MEHVYPNMDNEICLVRDGVGQHHLPHKWYRQPMWLNHLGIHYASADKQFHMYKQNGRWVISNLWMRKEVCAYAESTAMHPGTVYAGEWYILDPTTEKWPTEPHPTFKFTIDGSNTEQHPFDILDMGVDYFSRRVKCPSGPIWYKHFNDGRTLWSKGKAGCFQFCPCKMKHADDLENLCYTASNNFVTQHLKDTHRPSKPQNVRVSSAEATCFTIEWDAEDWKPTMRASQMPIGLCIQQNVDDEKGSDDALLWRDCYECNLYTPSPELRSITLPYTILTDGQAYRFRISALVTVPLSVWDDNRRPGAPSTWSEASDVLNRSDPTLAEALAHFDPTYQSVADPSCSPNGEPPASLHTDRMGIDDGSDRRISLDEFLDLYAAALGDD